MEEDTVVSLAFDKTLLYKNMVAAGADWLYGLEEWNDILDKMIFSFNYVYNETEGVGISKDNEDFNLADELNLIDRVNKGFELFGKYFLNLWD